MCEYEEIYSFLRGESLGFENTEAGVRFIEMINNAVNIDNKLLGATKL